MQDYLALIDRQTLGLPGMRCRDITPIFSDPQAFETLLDDLCRNLKPQDFDLVVGLEALGFIFATAVARRYQKGLIPIRKAGKLPVKTDALELAEVRGQKRTLELRSDALLPGTRVLIVDDWIRTGTQMLGAIQMLEAQGGVIAGVMAMNMDERESTQDLERYPVHTVFRNGKPTALVR